MENYFYKCKVCGFIHIVPAYWVSYEPEVIVEMEHINLKNGEGCPCNELELMEERE